MLGMRVGRREMEQETSRNQSKVAGKENAGKRKLEVIRYYVIVYVPASSNEMAAHMNHC